MTDTRAEGPDQRPYEEIFTPDGKALTVTLKGGGKAQFGVDGTATVWTSMPGGFGCEAVFKIVEGRVRLTRLSVGEGVGGNAGDIKADALTAVVKQLRADVREAFEVAWDKRGKAYAERRIRALPRQGMSREEEQFFQAAIVYNLAVLFGKDPTKTVTEYFGCSKATAKRWVAKARDEYQLIKKPDELRGGGFPEDQIPWLEEDDPQFMADFIKVMEEMAVIMPPRMYHLVRGAMFFEMLGQLMDAEGSGGEGADEGVRSAAQQLLFAMTGSSTLGDIDAPEVHEPQPAAPEG
ncbi:hypothetical protein [Streptomyces sp. NBC_00454]|uniref:hypothetical protein n=1 Tax=Streptomyces sp. NBC_00454 TaxID=2975747 RepID=UPI0030E5C0D7